jgi:ferrous iron transport protein A
MMDVAVLIPVEELDAGQWAEVAEVTGRPTWVSRMAELGVRTGSPLQMVRSGSPCVLRVGGCRLSLRGDLGVRVLVRPVADVA